MRTFKETLKTLRNERNISQGKLASIIGVDRSSVSKWESGDRTPELSVGRKIASYFGVSLDYLFGATDDPNQELEFRTPEVPTRRLGLLEGIGGMNLNPPPRLADYLPVTDDTISASLTMIPVIGCVRGGPGGLAREERLGVEPAQIRGRAEDYFYLKVVGDSMAPAINEGDLALVRRQDQAENGQLVVAIVRGEFNDEGVIKQYKTYPSAVSLISFNPNYEPRFFPGKEMNRIAIVGKVVQTVHKWD